MGDQVQGGVYQTEAVNIPIQLLSVTNRDGRITPLWFRLETEEHGIEKFRIEDIISRGGKELCRNKRKAVCMQDQAGRNEQDAGDKI